MMQKPLRLAIVAIVGLFFSKTCVGLDKEVYGSERPNLLDTLSDEKETLSKQLDDITKEIITTFTDYIRTLKNELDTANNFTGNRSEIIHWLNSNIESILLTCGDIAGKRGKKIFELSEKSPWVERLFVSFGETACSLIVPAIINGEILSSKTTKIYPETSMLLMAMFTLSERYRAIGQQMLSQIAERKPTEEVITCAFLALHLSEFSTTPLLACL